MKIRSKRIEPTWIVCDEVGVRQQRLERAHQLLVAQGRRDTLEAEMDEAAERHADDRELEVADLLPADGRDRRRVDHLPDEVEDQRAAEEADEARQEREAVAPLDEEVTPDERAQLAELADARRCVRRR